MIGSNPSNLVKRLLENRDAILGFILALTRNREVAEEIFQEVGLAVVEEAGRKTRVDRFLPWVRELARRRVAEHFRKNSRLRSVTRLDSLDDVVARSFEENPLEPGSAIQREEYLAECIEELPDTQRNLIEKHYRDRKPVRSIAGAIGSSVGAVKVGLWKARRRLAGCIEGKMGGEA